MKKEIAEQWVKDLRSGQFRQGRGSLCKDEKYCCLGVLCEQGVRVGVIIKRFDNGVVFYDESPGLLPPAIEKWARMQSRNGFIPSYCSLVRLNDEEGLNFNQIADHIETHWEAL